jgi:hypothetical protein
LNSFEALIYFLLQKYEFCLAIHEDKLVWCRGPVEASCHDMTFFRGGKRDKKVKVAVQMMNWDQNALYFKLKKCQKLVGDSGYSGEPNKIIVTSDNHPKEMKKWLARVKSRGETLHTLLKSYNILGNRFRHGKNTRDKMDMHQMVVEAICVIVQYGYENGHPPFNV